MKIKPIKTEEDYQLALNEIEAIFFAEPGTPEGDRLEILVTLVKDYESRQFPIPDPDPIEAIRFHMDRLNLTRKDLEPFLGSRARVSEILNRKRPLTISMIRRLQEGLGIPATILIHEYPLGLDTRRAEFSSAVK
jgi:HTH-type transcriptional regulator / antitoxin HigA